MNARPHLLFVCGRNLMRSPAAARIYANAPRIGDQKRAFVTP